ncbi:MAG TPA: hypothetical protein VII25_08035, partial [Candidatus Acidoferrum sp.]
MATYRPNAKLQATVLILLLTLLCTRVPGQNSSGTVALKPNGIPQFTEVARQAGVPSRTPPALNESSDAAAPMLAATPPLGWNSWDGYGTTVTEAQVKSNANWFAENLKPFGWQYIVVDMEWFVTNPAPEGNSKASLFSMDSNGRYTPAENRFPSASGGAGFKPLADYLHSLGLKFGIHIIRGIP